MNRVTGTRMEDGLANSCHFSKSVRSMPGTGSRSGPAEAKWRKFRPLMRRFLVRLFFLWPVENSCDRDGFALRPATLASFYQMKDFEATFLCATPPSHSCKLAPIHSRQISRLRSMGHVHWNEELRGYDCSEGHNPVAASGRSSEARRQAGWWNRTKCKIVVCSKRKRA